LAGCQAVWPLKRDFETVPSDGFSFIFMDIKNNFEGYYLRTTKVPGQKHL